MPILQEQNFSKEWAEPSPRDVEELLARCRRMRWDSAIDFLRQTHSAFVARLNRSWLADWSLLIRPQRGGTALDLGSGFATIALGLAKQFDEVTAVDTRPVPLAIGSYHARSVGARNVQFVQADGHVLPIAPGSFDFAVLNGVLEWAALGHAESSPTVAQEHLLHELRRVLTNDGVLAVAIENRFALETCLLTPDTHTGMLLLPLLPRWLAHLVYRVRTGKELASRLYGQSGYKRLFRRAGFREVRLLDVTPSYNDFDVIVDPTDAASYRLLRRSKLIRSFNAWAGATRSLIVDIAPRLLGSISYAYLVLAGNAIITLLDACHPMWKALQDYGVHPGQFRFGYRGRAAGSFTIVAHDGEQVTSLVEISAARPGGDDRDSIPDAFRGLASHLEFAGHAEFEGLHVYMRRGSSSYADIAAAS